MNTQSTFFKTVFGILVLLAMMLAPMWGWGQISVTPGTGFNLDGQGTGIYSIRPTGAHFSTGTNELVLQIVSTTYDGSAIDFDGDGNREIVVQTVGIFATASIQTRLYIFEAEGNNDFRQRSTVLIDQGNSAGTIGLMHGVDVGDVDGDGTPEVVSMSGQSSSCFLTAYDINTSTFAFTEIAQTQAYGTGGVLFTSPGTINQIKIVANKNGGTNNDIIVSNATGTAVNSQLFACEINGSAFVFVNSTAANSGVVINGGVIAFNHANMGDASDEEIIMVTEVATSNSLVIREYITSGTAPFGTAKTITTNWTATTTGSFTTVSIGDIDGDGDLDAVANDYNGKQLRAIKRTGVDTYTTEAILASALTLNSPAIELSNIDNDGKMQIIYSNGTSVVYRKHDGTADDFSSARWGSETTILSGLGTGTANAVSFVGGSSTTLDNDRTFDIVVGRSVQVTGQGDMDDDEVFFMEANRLFTSGTMISGNYDNVEIQTGTITLGGNSEVKGNMTITSGSFLIPSSISITVSGTLTNSAGNSGLVIKSDVTGTGSLLHSTSGVAATVERYFTGASQSWHLLSSPVAAQGIQPEFVPSQVPPTTTEDFFAWDEPSGMWINFKNTLVTPTWNDANGSTNFTAGRGYLVEYQATNPTKQFQGTLNTGAVSYPLSNSGTTGAYIAYNLAGNPYPSALDWKASDGAGYWARTSLVGSGGGYDMSIWNDAAGNYASFNSAGSSGINGGTQYIPVGQGFMVKAASAGSLGMENGVRVHNTQPFLKSMDQIANALRMKITGNANTYSDEIVVEFGHQDATGGAEKMFSFYETAPSLYTVKPTGNYSVDFRGEPGAIAIPVSFNAGADGDYVLNASQLESFPSSTVITLEDLKAARTQNLMQNPAYTFTATKNDEGARFFLHFGGAFSVNDKENGKPVSIYASGNSVYISNKSGTMLKGEVIIYNMIGQPVMSQHLSENPLTKINLSGRTGYYLVKVITGNTIYSGKVFINKE